MKRIKIVSAVVLVLATLVLLGSFLLWYGVGFGYHANAMRGQLGPSLLWLFALIAILNAAWAIRVAARGLRDQDRRDALSAWGIFVIVAATPYLTTNISTGHHVQFYIGDEAYSIPWQYNPINGKGEPGGTFFVIHVSYPGLIGQYDAGEEYSRSQLGIARHALGSQSFSGSDFVNLDDCSGDSCTLNTVSNAYFSDGKFLYYVHYQGIGSKPKGIPSRQIRFQNPDELLEFKRSLAALFDSFRV